MQRFEECGVWLKSGFAGDQFAELCCRFFHIVRIADHSHAARSEDILLAPSVMKPRIGLRRLKVSKVLPAML